MDTAYLAPEGFEEALEGELKNIKARYGRLFLREGSPQSAYWVQNIWKNPIQISFCSIGDAAAKLRSLHGLWAYYPTFCVRKGELIQKKLPYFSAKPLIFPSDSPKAPLGSWTLLNENTLLCSSDCSSPFAHGEIRFIETKEPPSRAYLKLWEFFTRIGKAPKRGAKCLEIGASPGSWTWVLSKLGAETIAIDRSTLDPKIRSLPGVSFFKKDAFSLRPDDFPQIEWVFSDVVCYPEKLLEWIRFWAIRDVNLVCTLKFQGKAEYGIVKEFEKIEGSKVMRLYHNKHELTWYRMAFR